MNSVNLVGRLTREPELRRTQQGTACCSFSLAVKRPMVADTTDFLDCVVWRQGAEYLCQYGHKGDVVAVSGNLTTRTWEDKDSNKRKAVEVVCNSVELLSSKKNDNSSAASNYPNTPTNDLVNRQYSQQSNLPQNAAYGQPTYQQQRFEPITGPDVNLPF